MHVFLNGNHYYLITFVIISTLTNFLLIFEILFNFLLKLYPGYGFVYLSFSNIIFAFMPEDDFGIKMKASKKLKKI